MMASVLQISWTTTFSGYFTNMKPFGKITMTMGSADVGFVPISEGHTGNVQGILLVLLSDITPGGAQRTRVWNWSSKVQGKCPTILLLLFWWQFFTLQEKIFMGKITSSINSHSQHLKTWDMISEYTTRSVAELLLSEIALIY